MEFAEFFNPRVAHHLLDVPLNDLIARVQRAIRDGDGQAIGKEPLKKLLLEQIPILRAELPATTHYDELTGSDAHEIVQELLSQHYLTFSDRRPDNGLYFEVTPKGSRLARAA
jgi:hypothetical protein